MEDAWFHCQLCHGTFPKAWTDAEALAAAQAEGVDVDDAIIVCEDCYRKANP